jgi:hypothetical protein
MLVAPKAAVRRVGGQWIRRLGLIPGGETDRLGEDDALHDTALEQPVMVFFPESPTNTYQLAQWYGVLRRLARTHPVVVITQDSRTTRAVRADSGLPVHCVARSRTLDGLVARSDIALCLYVGHNGRNFSALRFTSIVHVYLGHGDSDKAVSASNQVKAYDFCFVAGQAAADRMRRTVPLYDVDARVVLVGRPQLDDDRADEHAGHAPEAAPRVLYAPTWEGAQRSLAYGSVATHGEALVRSLLEGGLDVTYRPHPRTGANDFRARERDLAIRGLLQGAATGRVDTTTPLGTAFRGADVLVTDISSLAMEWLPTLKPLVVTTPAGADVVVPESPLLAAVPRLDATDAPRAAEVLTTILADDTTLPNRRALVDHYLGDVTPGAPTRRFIAACEQAIALRQSELARLRTLAQPQAGRVDA